MILNLISKYLNGEASNEEIAEIYRWIESSQANKNEFIALKKIWVMTAVTQVDLKTEWKLIQQKKSIKKPFKIITLFKYAAVLVTLTVISALSWNAFFKGPTRVNEIVLEIEDQNRAIKLQNIKTVFSTSENIITKHNNDELVYQNKSTSKPLSYHNLKIPNGKTFKVTLSDSTVVYINSGTTLKYPKQFGNSSSRQVFLEGEAYFEVKKDSKRAFLVSTNGISVEVLGTKFNLNTYEKNNEISCVLVEGSVKIYEDENTNNKSLLLPNQKATWYPNSKTLISKEVNSASYTAWMRNELIFNAVHFSAISKKLERIFNVEIKNNNTFLENQTFTGTINTKTSGLENILDLLSIDTPFEYKKEGSIITISNK